MLEGVWNPGPKALTLTVDGTAVEEKVISAVLTEDMNGAEDPKIGSACAAVLTLTVQNPSRSYAGKRLTAAVGGVPLGVFTVTEVKTQDERAVITATDALGTAFEGAYVPTGTSGTALGVIRAICAACGVTLGDVTGVTDVQVDGLKAGRTCREMLGLMAALLGRNARMDRQGRLSLRWYAASGVTVTADDYYPGELTKADGDYGIDRIECTAVKNTSHAGEDVTTETTETVVYAAGTGSTGISITDDYMTQAILDGIFAEIGGLTYRPMTVSFYGDARIEPGDILTVTDGEGTSYTVPVMGVTHSWDGGVKTTVTACGNPAEGQSRSTGGYLSRSVSNLMAEFARFKNLEADNVEALQASVTELWAEWANIGTAIINTLIANGINADWIVSRSLQAQKIDLTDVPPIQVPNASDPDSLYPGQTIEDGWVRGGTIFDADFEQIKYLRGKTISFQVECLDLIYGGSSEMTTSDSMEAWAWEAASGANDEIAEASDGTPIYLFTHSVTIPSDCRTYKLSVYTSKIRNIQMTISGGGTTLVLDGSGLKINDFAVDRMGYVTFGDGKVSAIGTLANLNTSDKTSLVAAINEVLSGASPAMTARFG